MALTSIRNQLAPEFSGTDANVAPGRQHRQNDGSNLVLVDKKAPNVLLERGFLTCGNDQAERFHDSTNPVRKLSGDPDQSGVADVADRFCATLAAGADKIEQALGLNRDALTFAVPFQFRKRGVETKLINGKGHGNALDETLIRSIANDHAAARRLSERMRDG